MPAVWGDPRAIRLLAVQAPATGAPAMPFEPPTELPADSLVACCVKFGVDDSLPM
jgi:hypothetical protein